MYNVDFTDAQAAFSTEAKNYGYQKTKVPFSKPAPTLPIDGNDNLEHELLPPTPHTPTRFKPTAILGAPELELRISPSKSKAVIRKPVSAQGLKSTGTNNLKGHSSSSAIFRKPVPPIDMSVITNEIASPITSASSIPSTMTISSQRSSRGPSDSATIGATDDSCLLRDLTQSLEQPPTPSLSQDEIEHSRPRRLNNALKPEAEEECPVQYLIATIEKLQATIVILEAHASDWDDFDFKLFTPFGTPLNAFIKNRAPAEILQHVRKIVAEVQSEVSSMQVKEADTKKNLSKTQKKLERRKERKAKEQVLSDDTKLSKEEAIIHASEHAHDSLDKAMNQLHDLDYAKFKVLELRENTQTEIVWYSKEDIYPKHPNHQRTFMSNNLWCMNCKGMCAVCNRECCIHEQSLFYVRDGYMKQRRGMKKGDPNMEALGRELEATGKAMEADIKRWVVTGVDNCAFLECTNCHWFVCPRCVGICEVSQCQDTQCRRCLEAQEPVTRAPTDLEDQYASPTSQGLIKGQFPEFKGRNPFGKCDIHD